MTPLEICGALLTAIVPADAIPELRDDDIRQDVEFRLSQVGCELVYSHHYDCWVARVSRSLIGIDIGDSPEALDTKDLAVLAACWLHLRFLPAENSRLHISDDEALLPKMDRLPVTPLDVSELVDQLPALKRNVIEIAVGKLKRARFLVQKDGQLHAGPMLDALDEVRATEQARRLLLRHRRHSRSARGIHGGAWDASEFTEVSASHEVTGAAD